MGKHLPNFKIKILFVVIVTLVRTHSYIVTVSLSHLSSDLFRILYLGLTCIRTFPHSFNHILRRPSSNFPSFYWFFTVSMRLYQSIRSELFIIISISRLAIWSNLFEWIRQFRMFSMILLHQLLTIQQIVSRFPC